MSLLRQLQDATIATDQPLSAVLRTTMVLGVELKSSLLREWAYRELNGYSGDARVPPYRQSRPVALRGKFVVHRRSDKVIRDETRTLRRPERSIASPGITIRRYPPIDAQLEDVPIDPSRVEPPDHPALVNHSFLQPVTVYEDWLRTQTGDLRALWPREALTRYWDRLREGATCLEAWQVLSRSDLIGVVDGVRNGLLQFILELRRVAPAVEDDGVPKPAVARGWITQIFNTTFYPGVTMNDQSIHVQGSTIGNIAGGRDNPVQQGDVSITQQGMDLGALVDTLRAAVEQLDGQFPAEQLDATRGLVEDLEEEAAAPQPARHRMLRALKGITAIAGAAGGAGAAVIDAAQAIHRALGS